MDGSTLGVVNFPQFDFVPRKLLKKRHGRLNGKKQLEVLVEWQGRGFTTWEPYSSVTHKDKLESPSSLAVEVEDEEEGDDGDLNEGCFDVEVTIISEE